MGQVRAYACRLHPTRTSAQEHFVAWDVVEEFLVHRQHRRWRL